MPVTHGPAWEQYAFIQNKISRLVTNAHHRDRRPCKRWDTPIRKHLTTGWTHRFRPRRLGMRSSPSEGSIVRTGTIMGSAILAVSLLQLLPLPASLQESTVVNSIL